MSGDPLDPCNGRAFREAHAGPFFTADGKQLAVGERPRAQAPSDDGEQAPRPRIDPKLDRPRRPCSCCGRKFRPTARRWMLCATCFRYVTTSPLEPDG